VKLITVLRATAGHFLARGTSIDGRGLEGWSTKNDGVWGISVLATGVHGIREERGTGVVGESKTGRGVHGSSATWQGDIVEIMRE
jgi:hypothetical protein